MLKNGDGRWKMLCSGGIYACMAGYQKNTGGDIQADYGMVFVGIYPCMAAEAVETVDNKRL